MNKNEITPRNTMDEQTSAFSILCRICYDAERSEELITPCRCKGTVAFVHRSCLETWLAEANATNCELCHQVFQTERSPKYTPLRSIWRWCKYQPTANEMGRGIIGDILACSAITPMAFVITYVCLFSSDYYSQKKFSTVPAAKWTSVSLLVMIGIMLIGYYLWVFSIIKLHTTVWYNWWQRECIVRYIPPAFTELNVEEINETCEMISLDSSESEIPIISPSTVASAPPISVCALPRASLLPTIDEVDSERKIEVEKSIVIKSLSRIVIEEEKMDSHDDDNQEN